MIALGIVLATAHYAAFSVSYVRAEVVHSIPNPRLWRILELILGAPFGRPLTGRIRVDVFPIALVANSILWGAALTGATMGVMRLARRCSALSKAP